MWDRDDANSRVERVDPSPDEVLEGLARRVAGSSSAARQLRRGLARVARFPTTVLLTGETGTGKSEVARALHAVSPRAGAPFVEVDCAGLSDSLLAAELYGVARGGFTGAYASRMGRFEAARDGTLLLDEVGELSLAGQLKLLRVLEAGTFERIGESRTRQMLARVIAATHVNLESAVEDGRFRADLYYRLRVFSVQVPPLRDRMADLRCWLEIAADRVARRLGCSPPRFSPEAIARLEAYAWPGNLRELFHLVESLTILFEGDRIERGGIDELLASRDAPAPLDAIRSRNDLARERDRERPNAHRQELDSAIARAGGNLSLAARRLGMPRSTLRYRVGVDDVAARAAARRRRDVSPSIDDRP